MNRRDFLKAIPFLSIVSSLKIDDEKDYAGFHPYDLPEVKEFSKRWQEVDFHQDFNCYNWTTKRAPGQISFTKDNAICLTIYDNKGNGWTSENNGLTWIKE